MIEGNTRIGEVLKEVLKVTPPDKPVIVKITLEEIHEKAVAARSIMDISMTTEDSKTIVDTVSGTYHTLTLCLAISIAMNATAAILTVVM